MTKKKKTKKKRASKKKKSTKQKEQPVTSAKGSESATDQEATSSKEATSEETSAASQGTASKKKQTKQETSAKKKKDSSTATPNEVSADEDAPQTSEDAPAAQKEASPEAPDEANAATETADETKDEGEEASKQAAKATKAEEASKEASEETTEAEESSDEASKDEADTDKTAESDDASKEVQAADQAAGATADAEKSHAADTSEEAQVAETAEEATEEAKAADVDEEAKATGVDEEKKASEDEATSPPVDTDEKEAKRADAKESDAEKEAKSADVEGEAGKEAKASDAAEDGKEEASAEEKKQASEDKAAAEPVDTDDQEPYEAQARELDAWQDDKEEAGDKEEGDQDNKGPVVEEPTAEEDEKKGLSEEEAAPSGPSKATSEEESQLPTIDGDYLPLEKLQSLLQSPERGVFLFHRRARRRLFLDKVGLDHKHPLPESPVTILDTREFQGLLELEDPDLSRDLAFHDMPPKVMLLEQLSSRRLRKTSVENVLWRYWSWMVAGELMCQWDNLRVPVDEMRELLGHTTFEEVRSYFVRERYVFFPHDDEEVARNLVGWWGMLTHFAPYYRRDLFPSIREEALDRWLEEKGLNLAASAAKWRPPVANEIPQHLPIPTPKPWITWGLAEDWESADTTASETGAPVREPVADDKARISAATPPPAAPSERSGRLRQPSWGALVLLGALLGGSGVLLYLTQRVALVRIKELLGTFSSLGGPFHQTAPPLDPYGLMTFVWGGLLLMLLAHLLDMLLQWRLLRPRKDHDWTTLLSPDDLAHGRTHCRHLTEELRAEVERDTTQANQETPWWKQALLTIGHSLYGGLYNRIWGTLLELYPMQSLPFPALDRWMAHRKLAFHLFSYRYHLHHALYAQQRGNDLAALQWLTEALTNYRPLCPSDDELWEELRAEQVHLQRRVTILFGERIPHMASPSGRALFSAVIFVVVMALVFPSIQGMLWSVFWGFVFYLMCAQFMDVQVANRGHLHFWRRPVWIHYITKEELESGQRSCQSKAEQIWQEHTTNTGNASSNDRPIYLEVLGAVGRGIWWWIKVRLWGRFLTGLLFHWGRLPILLRFTAHEIMRKQVFEFVHHLEWAAYAQRRGNDAEAAIQLTDAIAYYRPLTGPGDKLFDQLYEEREKLVDTMVEQLMETHGIQASHRASIRAMIVELLDVPLSTRLGQQCAALLKTLQRSYLDKERQFYVTRPLRWLVTLGRTPIERSLDHYGLVRALHYLQSSIRKISLLPLSDEKRRVWERPLFEALEQLEHAIRVQFRPMMLEAMAEAGYTANTHRERVAQNKICAELLDQVIRGGRFSFSDVRDVISRNDLRLHDPAWRELFTNDVLLRLDRNFEERFDEIYRESEVYLRWLQRVSNVSFGTSVGRWLVKYVLIPFGGSATLLIFAASMIEAFYKLSLGQENYHSPLKETFPIIALGVIIALIVHTETGRDIFRQIIQGIGRVFRFVFVDGPRWLLERTPVQDILRHPKAFAWYRFVLIPLLVGLLLFGSLAGLLGLFGVPIDWLEMTLLFGFSQALSFLFFNTPAGRALWDQMAYRSIALWQQIKDRWVIGLYRWIIDTFRLLLHTLDYIIYRGDDLLRFHPGEGRSMIVVKAVGQAIWSAVAYLTRMIVNLFVEPQVNPIKHFPVVTVSHKMISAATAGLIPWMVAQNYSTLWITVASALFQLALPGLCGFLVWEFKENWKLFQANQPDTPPPARVGSHGETVDALLRRGFHSGTLPKIYEKLNQYVQREYIAVDRSQRRRMREQLHHVEEALLDFLDREFLEALRSRQELHDHFSRIEQEKPLLSPNHIDFFFRLYATDTEQSYRWRLRIELEGGLLVGSLTELESPRNSTYRLTEGEQAQMDLDLQVLLQKSGVRLMRSKLEMLLRFYTRHEEVGPPGSVAGPKRVEYTVRKDEVVMRQREKGKPDKHVRYRLDEKGRLYEPAPVVTLTEGDPLLPRPLEARALQLSGQFRVAESLQRENELNPKPSG